MPSCLQRRLPGRRRSMQMLLDIANKFMERRRLAIRFSDLRPNEQRLVQMLRDIGFGRLEDLRVERGEVIFNPAPTVIRTVHFGSSTSNQPTYGSANFELKTQVIELIELIRKMRTGRIRTLQIRSGLPVIGDVETGAGREYRSLRLSRRHRLGA